MVEEILHDSTVDEPGNVYSKNVNVYSLWILMANPAMDPLRIWVRGGKTDYKDPTQKRASQGVPRGDGQWLEAMDCVCGL